MTDFSNNDQKVSTPRPIGRGKGIGLLIHLWWAQKRRTFRWMDVFVGCYFGFLFCCKERKKKKKKNWWI